MSKAVEIRLNTQSELNLESRTKIL